MSETRRWLTVREAAAHARCGPKSIYRAVRSGQLRAARIGGRRELRFLESWIDEWLLRDMTGADGQHRVVVDGPEPSDAPASLR